MSKPSNVPKFGIWNADDQMPFTIAFERARADHREGTGAGNKMINPNDPVENASAFGLKYTEAPPSSRRSSQQYYKEESERKVDVARVGRPNLSGGSVKSTMVEHVKKGPYGGMGDSEGMSLREGHKNKQSGNHTSSPLRGPLGNNRPTTPSYLGLDKKGLQETSTPPHPPTKARFRPASRGEDTFFGSTLPKFGDWNEKDPSSGDNFTAKFSDARIEKLKGGQTLIPLHQSDFPVKADFDDDVYKSPHQSFQQKVARWLCFCRA